MGRVPNFKALRARSTEEQMLATMLVAGLVFAAVSLVAFLRPGGSPGSASARGPEINASARGDAKSSTSGRKATSSSGAARFGAAPVSAGSPAPASTVTEQLQSLFASVLTPLGFSTNLPTTLQPTSASVAIRPAAVGGPGTTTTTFPTQFQPLPGTLPPPPPTLPPPTTLPPTTTTTVPPTTQPPTTTTLPPATTTTAPPDTTTTTAPPDTTTTTAPPDTTTTTGGLLPGVLP